MYLLGSQVKYLVLEARILFPVTPGHLASSQCSIHVVDQLKVNQSTRTTRVWDKNIFRKDGRCGRLCHALVWSLPHWLWTWLCELLWPMEQQLIWWSGDLISTGTLGLVLMKCFLFHTICRAVKKLGQNHWMISDPMEKDLRGQGTSRMSQPHSQVNAASWVTSATALGAEEPLTDPDRLQTYKAWWEVIRTK